MGTFTSKIADEEKEFSKVYDDVFDRLGWTKHADFKLFSKQYLRFHNRSNYLGTKQSTLTLYLDRGRTPMVPRLGDCFIPDPAFDTWKNPILSSRVHAIYSRQPGIVFAGDYAFVLDDGRCYKLVAVSGYHDKISIKEADVDDLRPACH